MAEVLGMSEENFSRFLCGHTGTKTFVLEEIARQLGREWRLIPKGVELWVRGVEEHERVS